MRQNVIFCTDYYGKEKETNKKEAHVHPAPRGLACIEAARVHDGHAGRQRAQARHARRGGVLPAQDLGGPGDVAVAQNCRVVALQQLARVRGSWRRRGDALLLAIRDVDLLNGKAVVQPALPGLTGVRPSRVQHLRRQPEQTQESARLAPTSSCPPERSAWSQQHGCSRPLRTLHAARRPLGMLPATISHAPRRPLRT